MFSRAVFFAPWLLFSFVLGSEIECNHGIFGPGSNNWAKSDLEGLFTSITSGTLDPPLESNGLGFGPSEGRTIAYGDFQLCFQNLYLFAGTHVPESELANATQTMINCCTEEPCQGGEGTVTGDTGITIHVLPQHWGETCKGGLKRRARRYQA